MPPRESLKSLTMTQRPPWMTRLKAQCLAEARSKRANIAMARRRRVLADKPIWTMQQTQGEEGDDDLGQSGSFDDGDQDEESLQNLLRLNWARTLAEAAATGIPPLDEETANRLEEEMLAELEGEGDDFERMAEDQLKILDAELDDCLATHHGSNVMVAPCMVCQRGYLHNESPHTIQCNACTARMSFSTATTVGEVVDQLVSLADLHGQACPGLLLFFSDHGVFLKCTTCQYIHSVGYFCCVSSCAHEVPIMHSMHPFAPGAQICFICFWVSNQFFEIPIPRLIMHVLSIQSHVVHGYVGNKAATFPLQLLGFEVDPLNAVQFSNHTGYPKFTGERLEGPQIEKLLEGLELNGMLEHYSHLLTGYLGRASTLHAVAGLVAKLRQLNPQVIFVLDPVMGDEGSLYVPPELVPIYRDVLCPLADVVTPNAFEAEQLTGIPINSTQNARLALSNIHNLGVPTVIITSAELADTQQDSESRTLHLLASRRLPKSGRLYQFTVEFPKLDVSFTGTGDMFSALLLANIHLGEKEARKVEEALILNDEQEDTIAGVALRTACERAVASMQGVLADTLARYKKRTKSWKNDCGRKGSPEMMRSKELTVVQSRERIERPEVVYQAKDLHE